MKRWSTRLTAFSAVALFGASSAAFAVDGDSLRNADKDPNNWLTYHGSYKAWHYSDLSQINAANVKNMRVAWLHTPSASKRGIQSFPLAVDGTLFYSSASGQVWALDGATGEVKWKHAAKLDQERSEGTFFNPYNRGLAVGYGNVYTATTDGRMIALDMNTGKVVWDKMILTVEGGNKGFTGAPLLVKDMVLVGANGGELSGCCGPIFAVDAKTGEVRW